MSVHEMFGDIINYYNSCQSNEDAKGVLDNMGQHTLALYDVVYAYKDLKQPLVLELGRGKYGGSLIPMAMAAKQTNGKIISVDIEAPTQSIWKRAEKLNLRQNIQFIVSNDQDPRLIKRFKRDGLLFDVIFLDTSHTLDDTFEELKIYPQFLISGGFMLFHDCPFKPYPVEDILKEFLRKTNKFNLISERVYSQGLTIIQRRRK